MTAKMLQVLVGPGRPHFSIKTGLVAVAVPAEAEAIAIGGADRFLGLEALHDQRMGRCGDIAFEGDGLSAIGNPAAHGPNPNVRYKSTTIPVVAQRRSQRVAAPRFGEKCGQTVIPGFV